MTVLDGQGEDDLDQEEGLDPSVQGQLFRSSGDPISQGKTTDKSPDHKDTSSGSLFRSSGEPIKHREEYVKSPDSEGDGSAIRTSGDTLEDNLKSPDSEEDLMSPPPPVSSGARRTGT